jgi:hypothetical protein
LLYFAPAPPFARTSLQQAHRTWLQSALFASGTAKIRQVETCFFVFVTTSKMVPNWGWLLVKIICFFWKMGAHGVDAGVP